MLRISDLKDKDVINVKDGKRLGYIDDIEVDMENGRVTALVIPAAERGLFGFRNRGDETVVDWKQISRIGVDVILVDPTFRKKQTVSSDPEPKSEQTVCEDTLDEAFDIDIYQEPKDVFRL